MKNNMTTQVNRTRFYKHRRVLIRCIKEGLSEVNTGILEGKNMETDRVIIFFNLSFPVLIPFQSLLL